MTQYLQPEKYNTVFILKNYKMDNQLHPSSREKSSVKNVDTIHPKSGYQISEWGILFVCFLMSHI